MKSGEDEKMKKEEEISSYKAKIENIVKQNSDFMHKIENL